ncbi:MAG: hypothetical protein AAFN77_09275 [Planctomycetota bacterium]
MLPRNIDNPGASPPSWWEELGFGAPTIAAFARLCADALQRGVTDKIDPNDEKGWNLSVEAKTILWLSRARGTFEIRANKDGFDSAERFLAVAVELEVDRWRVLLDKQSPEQTVRFLDGFRELCARGLLLHHLQREFSLSARGFELSKELESEPSESLASFGLVIEL